MVTISKSRKTVVVRSIIAREAAVRQRVTRVSIDATADTVYELPKASMTEIRGAVTDQSRGTAARLDRDLWTYPQRLDELRLRVKHLRQGHLRQGRGRRTVQNFVCLVVCRVGDASQDRVRLLFFFEGLVEQGSVLGIT